MNVFADAALLAAKDLRAEARSRGALAAAGALGAVAFVVAAMAAGPDRAQLRQLAPALTWLALLYAAIAMADRLDLVDRRDDAFSALWLALEDRRAIYLGKVLALAVVLLVLQGVLFGLAVVLLDLPLSGEALWLAPVAVVAALGAAATSVLVVALAGASGQRTLLMPLLLLPLMVPVLLAAVESTGAILVSAPAAALQWLALSAAQAALFAGLGVLVYEHAATPE